MMDLLKQALQQFEKSTNSPSDYLTEHKTHAERHRSLLKLLFDFSNSVAGSYNNSKNLPDELYVEHMDEEQIWQQLELYNNSFWERCMTDSCHLLAFNEDKFHIKFKYADQEDKKSANHDGNRSDDLNKSDKDTFDGSSIDLEKSEKDEIESDDEDLENKCMEEKSLPFHKKNRSSIVDDDFFNLSEMEAFLDLEDKKELARKSGNKSSNNSDDDEDVSDDEIDYFDEIDSSDVESENEVGKKSNSIMYSDFFDETETKKRPESKEEIIRRKRSEREEKNARKKQEMKEDLGIEDSSDEEISAEYHDEEEDDNNDNQIKSEFDMRQERLKKRIEQLEEEALREKPWQLKGEITSAVRPKNSLLEEVLDFESTMRPPPLITEETTLCLEDIIKRRIKSKAWDDVERKIKPISDARDFRKNLVLSQEKSKESLAQIYEREYLEKVHKMNNVEDMSKSDEPPEHSEIRKSMKELFVKLDALSNFHFTAKPVAAEAKIITNIPAIEMEEVAPVAVSDATLLAPEEIKPRLVGDEIGKLERTRTDKNRERRKKKLKQKLIKIQQDKRIEEKEKLGIKVTTKEKQQQLLKKVTKSRNVIKGKNAADKDSKALKSSKDFFTQLQDTVSTVKSKSFGKKKKPNFGSTQDGSSAKRFKL